MLLGLWLCRSLLDGATIGTWLRRACSFCGFGHRVEMATELMLPAVAPGGALLELGRSSDTTVLVFFPSRASSYVLQPSFAWLRDTLITVARATQSWSQW